MCQSHHVTAKILPGAMLTHRALKHPDLPVPTASAVGIMNVEGVVLWECHALHWYEPPP